MTTVELFGGRHDGTVIEVSDAVVGVTREDVMRGTIVVEWCARHGALVHCQCRDGQKFFCCYCATLRQGCCGIFEVFEAAA